MWELDHKQSWAPKNGWFWTVVLEKTLESPLDSQEVKPVNPKGNQSWIFIGRTDAEAETPILWPPDATNWLIRKNSLILGTTEGRRRGWERNEMVGWHHRLNGHELSKLWELVTDREAGMLQPIGSQRVGHNWATGLNIQCPILHTLHQTRSASHLLHSRFLLAQAGWFLQQLNRSAHAQPGCH